MFVFQAHYITGQCFIGLSYLPGFDVALWLFTLEDFLVLTESNLISSWSYTVHVACLCAGPGPEGFGKIFMISRESHFCNLSP